VIEISLLEIIGWVGAVAFAICGAPQAWSSFKNKNSEGISSLFLYLWLIGEVATIIYVLPKGHLPLLFNYLANLLFISVILYYKLKPKN
jgi:uncharacterized protein with PQ loop repeat